MAEIHLQSQCFQWTWNTFPETRYMFFSVPNESKRSLILAQQLKASGMISGIPDMILIHRGRPYGFEFKDGSKGKRSPNQVKVHEIWANYGVPVYVIRDFLNFQAIFTHIIKHDR